MAFKFSRATRVACLAMAFALGLLVSNSPAMAQSCGVPHGYLSGGVFQAWRAIQSNGTLYIYRLGDLRSPITGDCSGNCRSASDKRSVSTLSLSQASSYLSAEGAAWAASQGFSSIKLVSCSDNEGRDRDTETRDTSPPPPPPPPDDDEDEYDEGEPQ